MPCSVRKSQSNKYSTLTYFARECKIREMAQSATRGSKPHGDCHATMEALMENGLKVLNDCPLCAKQGVLCEVGYHPSSAAGLEVRPTKIRRVEAPVECNIRVQCLTRQVNGVTGETLTGETLAIDGLPNIVSMRYLIPSNISIYCRKCYSSLYSSIKNVVLKKVANPAMLISGVPGIGKSLFSIYFMIQMMLDEEFPVKQCFVEYEAGVYHKFTLANCHITTATDPPTQVKWIAELRLQIEQCVEINPITDFVLSDIKGEVEPKWGGRWTCIFSSPNPKRYKETMNASHNYHFTMPTWSEHELLLVNDNIDDWYDRFVTFGGVPRFVLWDGEGSDPLIKLQSAMDSKGSNVIKYFFQHGFGNVDPEKSYMLIHINPLWLSEHDDWHYLGTAIHSFASDEIFQTLSRKYERDLLSQAIDFFNAGVAPEVYGGGSAGNLFEKVVLWLKPIAGQIITLKSLTDGTELVLTLPSAEILPRHWKSSTNADDVLRPGCLYQPRISNLESGDCFGVVEYDGAYVLVVLQMTVNGNHPIKANGLNDIVLAYPLDVRNALSKKLLGFVIPMNGALRSVQPLHTKNGKVIERIPTEVQGFEQYVCQYKI